MDIYNPCIGCEYYNKPYWSVVSPCAACPKLQGTTGGYVTTTTTAIKTNLHDDEAIACTLKPATDVAILHVCPKCGKSYYMEKHRECTTMYFPPIYKDGVNINPDRNTTTVYCRCMECGHEFDFKE